MTELIRKREEMVRTCCAVASAGGWAIAERASFWPTERLATNLSYLYVVRAAYHAAWAEIGALRSNCTSVAVHSVGVIGLGASSVYYGRFQKSMEAVRKRSAQL